MTYIPSDLELVIQLETGRKISRLINQISIRAFFGTLKFLKCGKERRNKEQKIVIGLNVVSESVRAMDYLPKSEYLQRMLWQTGRLKRTWSTLRSSNIGPTATVEPTEDEVQQG